jgi:nucleotide-binding universal stress UspA family protein
VVLICYDGSADAKAAIERAGELLRGEPARVLTVWTPIALLLARSMTGLTAMAGALNMEEGDKASRDEAAQCAAEGAGLARVAGIDASPRTCEQETTIASAILDEAETVGASAVVMGSRGLTGLKSLLLGSVSHSVIQHADRTVIVVPSPSVARARAHSRHPAPTPR